MSDLISSLASGLAQTPLPQNLKEAGRFLTNLVEAEAYVGEVYSLGYQEALVQIHDYDRQRVGGIPALSFLIATRIVPHGEIDLRIEDSSIILLRVLDKANLPNAYGSRACPSGERSKG